MTDWDEDEPIPPFGKRKARPPVTEEEKREKMLEEFRAEARSLLDENRERDAEEIAEAKSGPRKAKLFRFGRSGSDADEAASEPELSEEEEWNRRMSRQPDPDPEPEDE